MSFCPYCGKPLNETDKFCQYCGAAVAAAQPPVTPVTPAPVAPVTPVAPVAPVAPAAPEASSVVYQTQKPVVVSGKAKAFGFVGMGLSIEGLIMAVLGLFYTFFGLLVDGAMGDMGAGIGFIYSFVFSFFALPSCIIGNIFSNKAIAMGNPSGVCTAGFRLGKAGIIVSIVTLVLGFFSLIAMAA